MHTSIHDQVPRELEAGLFTHRAVQSEIVFKCSPGALSGQPEHPLCQVLIKIENCLFSQNSTCQLTNVSSSSAQGQLRTRRTVVCFDLKIQNF